MVRIPTTRASREVGESLLRLDDDDEPPRDFRRLISLSWTDLGITDTSGLFYGLTWVSRTRLRNRLRPGSRQRILGLATICSRAGFTSHHTFPHGSICGSYKGGFTVRGSTQPPTARRTKASLIYRRRKSLRAIQLLLGHTKLESAIRYLGVEVDDTLELAEQTEV